MSLVEASKNGQRLRIYEWPPSIALQLTSGMPVVARFRARHLLEGPLASERGRYPYTVLAGVDAGLPWGSCRRLWSGRRGVVVEPHSFEQCAGPE